MGYSSSLVVQDFVHQQYGPWNVTFPNKKHVIFDIGNASEPTINFHRSILVLGSVPTSPFVWVGNSFRKNSELQEPPSLPKLSLAAWGLNGDAGLCQDHHVEHHDHSSWWIVWRHHHSSWISMIHHDSLSFIIIHHDSSKQIIMIQQYDKY